MTAMMMRVVFCLFFIGFFGAAALFGASSLGLQLEGRLESDTGPGVRIFFLILDLLLFEFYLRAFRRFARGY